MVAYNVGLLKHFAPWEIFWCQGNILNLKIVWFFWSRYLSQFSINLSFKTLKNLDLKCFNTPTLCTTDTLFYNSSVNIGPISFFLSSDTHQSHHLLGINSLFIYFLSVLHFLNVFFLIFLIRLKVKNFCLRKKLFWL